MDIESEEKNYDKLLNLKTVTLDMYNVPPVEDFKLSRLAKKCE